MADFGDMASDLTERDLEEALAAHKKPFVPSLEYCDECGETIPVQRQAIGNVTHCIVCATLLEKKRKLFAKP